MWQFIAQMKPHEIITAGVAILSLAIALGALLVGIYSMSLSWKTMTLLHRPFIAVMRMAEHEIQSKDAPPGVSHLPLGTRFPLAGIERVRLSFVIENTGAALAEDVASQMRWIQGQDEWTDPEGGISEMAPRQDRRILADIPGDAIRRAVAGATLKGELRIRYSNAVGDAFRVMHHFVVRLTWDREKNALYDVIIASKNRDEWTALN